MVRPCRAERAVPDDPGSVHPQVSQWPALANRTSPANQAGRQALWPAPSTRLPFPTWRRRKAWTRPRDTGTIEWFASPDDICRAFAGLQQLAAQPRLAPLGSVLSANNGGVGLDPAQWPTVWFKGGSEPGVLTLGYLATNSKGQTFVVVAMLNDPAAALSPSAGLDCWPLPGPPSSWSGNPARARARRARGRYRSVARCRRWHPACGLTEPVRSASPPQAGTARARRAGLQGEPGAGSAGPGAAQRRRLIHEAEVTASSVGGLVADLVFCLAGWGGVLLGTSRPGSGRRGGPARRR